jgi:hypothetical protein
MPSLRCHQIIVLGILGIFLSSSDGFSVLSGQTRHVVSTTPRRLETTATRRTTTTTTRLNVLVDVPDNFFAFTFPVLGIMLSISKSFGRLRMEERAWEQRLEEAREKRLREDPTLTEIELRRKEAALEWSAYDKPANNYGKATEQELESRSGGRRPRVKVMDREEDNVVESRNQYRMSDEEISLFEMEYGIEYDPYYDDPYTEDELPNDIPFNVDRRYGDRIYENGEIFYKDKESGLFFRQGAKPRSLSFWK